MIELLRAEPEVAPAATAPSLWDDAGEPPARPRPACVVCGKQLRHARRAEPKCSPCGKRSPTGATVRYDRVSAADRLRRVDQLARWRAVVDAQVRRAARWLTATHRGRRRLLRAAGRAAERWVVRKWRRMGWKFHGGAMAAVVRTQVGVMAADPQLVRRVAERVVMRTRRRLGLAVTHADLPMPGSFAAEASARPTYIARRLERAAQGRPGEGGWRRDGGDAGQRLVGLALAGGAARVPF